jgi:hypothetical protein
MREFLTFLNYNNHSHFLYLFSEHHGTSSKYLSFEMLPQYPQAYDLSGSKLLNQSFIKLIFVLIDNRLSVTDLHMCPFLSLLKYIPSTRPLFEISSRRGHQIRTNLGGAPNLF